jgi:DNA-binding response OmpR family regulator
VVDDTAHRAWIGATELELSDPEFRLLALMKAYAGSVLTYWQIGQLAWGSEASGALILLTMHSLLRKLGDEAMRSHDIVTIRDVGLRFERRAERRR